MRATNVKRKIWPWQKECRCGHFGDDHQKNGCDSCPCGSFVEVIIRQNIIDAQIKGIRRIPNLHPRRADGVGDNMTKQQMKEALGKFKRSRMAENAGRIEVAEYPYSHNPYIKHEPVEDCYKGCVHAETK